MAAKQRRVKELESLSVLIEGSSTEESHTPNSTVGPEWIPLRLHSKDSHSEDIETLAIIANHTAQS